MAILDTMSMRPSATAQRWQRLIDLQAQSGLSVRAFAVERGVNPNTLAWWKSRLGRTACMPSFLPVQIVPSSPPPVGHIEIGLRSGRVVRVHGDVDAAALRRILAALESVP